LKPPNFNKCERYKMNGADWKFLLFGFAILAGMLFMIGFKSWLVIHHHTEVMAHAVSK